MQAAELGQGPKVYIANNSLHAPAQIQNKALAYILVVIVYKKYTFIQFSNYLSELENIKILNQMFPS